jgi:SAM-dependent methyltransferase
MGRGRPGPPGEKIAPQAPVGIPGDGGGEPHGAVDLAGVPGPAPGGPQVIQPALTRCAHAASAARDAAAAAAGVADRVSFEAGDAAQLTNEGPFDLVTMFEALHDMGDPVGALRAARRLLAEGGSVLVADERVADSFTAPGDATERLMYGWSILHCLPATLAENPVEATGTVLRAPTLAGWAAAAGFAVADVVAIDNPFWRFYRLRG